MRHVVPVIRVSEHRERTTGLPYWFAEPVIPGQSPVAFAACAADRLTAVGWLVEGLQTSTNVVLDTIVTIETIFEETHAHAT